MVKYHSISLRLWLPIVVLIMIITLLFSNAWEEKNNVISNWYHLSESIVSRDMVSLSHEIESEFDEGNPEHSAYALLLKGADKRFTTLVLADTNQKILYSANSNSPQATWLSQLPHFNVLLLQLAVDSNHSEVNINEESNLISAYFPVSLSSPDNSHEKDKKGIIFAVYNLKDEYDLLWTKTLKSTQYFLAIFLVVIALLIAFLRYFIARPIQHLVDVTRSIAHGDFRTQCLIKGKGELAHLGDAFNSMSKELLIRERQQQDTNNKLKLSEQRWQFALNASRSGVWEWKIDSDHVYFSKRWKELLGYQQKDIGDSIEDWKQRVHPEDQAQCFSALELYLTGKAPIYESEHRMRCKNGQYSWVLDRGLLIQEEDNDSEPSKMIGAFTEINHLKENANSDAIHLNFLNEMERINQVIIHADTLDALMSELLQAVLELFKVDRAWLLFPCDPKTDFWCVPMEKTRPEYPGALSLNRDAPISPEVIKAFSHALDTHDVVTIDTYTDEAAKKTAEQFNTKSEMHIAIHPKMGQPWLFGVHQCDHVRHWMKEDVDLFREIAHRLTDALSSRLFLRDLQQSEQRYRSIFQSTKMAVIVMDKSGLIVEWNDAATNIFGYHVDDIIGENISLLVPEVYKNSHTVCFNEVMAQQKLKKPTVTHQLNGLHQSGRVIPMELTLSNWLIDGESSFCAIIHDISERLKHQEIITRQAHYDALTDLPNRFLSLDRLNILLGDAQRHKKKIALLFLDLDGFKKVNDTLGHDVGDDVLIEAARRLSHSVRAGDTVGRLGGDEFIVLLGDIEHSGDTQTAVDNILKQFRQVFNINKHKLMLTMSGGIAIFPNDGQTSLELLKNADSAMYHAKQLGRNQFSFFTEAMNQKAMHRLELEEELEGALERNEFEVVYQPKIEINSGKVTGAEALLRWHNPKLGQVSPDVFIGVAEQTGLIETLGQFVLTEALAQTAKWRQIINDTFCIAINLSPRQFRDPELLDCIDRAIINAKLPYNAVELEITEGVLLSNNPEIMTVLKGLESLGVSISLDDFGTGYSSLSYLSQYPFNVLKIDRSFVNHIVDDSSSRELVNAIISMARSLKLNVVAEGVENKEQLDILTQLDCQYAQGFFFSKPISAIKMDSFLLDKSC